jgi:tetratricopeptide (TPR) repeat protein
MRLHLVAAFLLFTSPAFAATEAPPGEVAPPFAMPSAAPDLARSARLDELFAELQHAPTRTAAKEVELSILAEWHRSGDAEVDKMFTAALMAMNLRAFGTAIAILDKIVEARPDFAEGWNKRATVYYYVNEYDRSLADIERTLALEPRHFGALAGLGMIMQDTGNIPGAIAAFEEAVAVNPTLTNLQEAIEQLKARVGRDI